MRRRLILVSQSTLSGRYAHLLLLNPGENILTPFRFQALRISVSSLGFLYPNNFWYGACSLWCSHLSS